jgi:hypothetical protein
MVELVQSCQWFVEFSSLTNVGRCYRSGLGEERPFPIQDFSRAFSRCGGISFAFSVTLCIWIDREIGLFVGLWVPSILSLTDLLPRLQQPNPDPIRNRANAGAQHRTP